MASPADGTVRASESWLWVLAAYAASLPFSWPSPTPWPHRPFGVIDQEPPIPTKEEDTYVNSHR